MTFKERYQSGLCQISDIETCIQQWENEKDCRIPLAEYLGLTDLNMPPICRKVMMALFSG